MRSNSLGEIIRSLRKQAGLSQEELADGICSPVSISRIENGTQMPSGNVLDETMEAIRMGEELLAALKKHKSVLREYLVIKINLAFNLAQFMEKEKRYKEALMYCDYAEELSINSAEYIALLNQNLGTLEENYIKNVFSLLESGICILTAICLLILINPVIAVISIISMTVPGLIPNCTENVTCITVTHHLNPESEKRYDEVLKMEDGTLVKKE